MATWPALPGLLRVGSSVVARLGAQAAELGMDPVVLAAIIDLETMATWSAGVRNPDTLATGLLQWIPSTARGLGMAPKNASASEASAAVAALGEIGQAAWVARTFRAGGARNTASWRPEDWYLPIFAPRAIGKPDSAIICEVDSKCWLANRGMRLPADGPITAGSIRAVMRAHYERVAKLPRVEIGGASGARSGGAEIVAGAVGLAALLLALLRARRMKA